VLIDPGVAQKAEALLVLRVVHDEIVIGRRAAHEEITDDRRAGRRSTHHTAAGEHVVETLLGLRTGVRVHEVKLPAALEPHSAGFLENGAKESGVGELVLCVQDVDVRPACLTRVPGAFGCTPCPASRRHVDDQRVRLPAAAMNRE
jgi:hypothetical protein